MRRRPDAIWLPHWDYTQMIRDLLDDPEFWARYDFYPDAFTYGVAGKDEFVENWWDHVDWKLVAHEANLPDKGLST